MGERGKGEGRKGEGRREAKGEGEKGGEENLGREKGELGEGEGRTWGGRMRPPVPTHPPLLRYWGFFCLFSLNTVKFLKIQTHEKLL